MSTVRKKRLLNKGVGSDPLRPSASLLCKLGSIALHAEELFSPRGHHFDKTALEVLLNDYEVREWITAMGALLPKKR
jgi:hypothetical protein